MALYILNNNIFENYRRGEMTKDSEGYDTNKLEKLELGQT